MFVSSKDVIDSVAENIKYYIDIQRKEDGFDLSGIDAPQMHFPNLKPLPIVGIEKIHDRSLKHYFNDPNIRTTLQMSFGRTIEKQERKLQLNYNREMCVQRMIRKKMSKLDFSNFGPQNALNLEKLKIEKRERIQHFPKTLHQIPPPHITRSEVLRLICSASKLIVATEIIPQNPCKKCSSKKTMKLDILKRNGEEAKWTEYEVTVCTGNCLRLGSKANIFISFHGEKDKVKDILLWNSFTNHIPFQNNQTDVFLVETQDVGKLKYIKIGYDSNEPGCGWYLKDIIIKNCSNATSAYVFHCNMWFSSKADDKHSFQTFMPYFGADLENGESIQKEFALITQKGQNGKSKQRTEISRVVCKAALEPQASRSTKGWLHMATNKIPASFYSTTSSATNSDQVFSHQRPSSSSKTTLRCESPIKLMEKSFSRAQLEFCSPEVQNSLAETTERWSTSSTPLKSKDIFKEVSGVDEGRKINDENSHENFSCISSDEMKVTEKTDKLTCTEDISSNCTKESFSEDEYYCGKLDQLLPGSFIEDGVQSDLFGSKSEKEWTDVANSPKCTSEVPRFVHGPLKMARDTECKPLLAATQYSPENIAVVDDDNRDEVNNNLVNMKWNSTKSIQSNDRNTEFMENAGTSLLQEGNVTTEIAMGLISSATNKLESLQHVQSSKSNSVWDVEELDHTEPLQYAEEDQVKEPVISEVSKTDSLPKEGSSATDLNDSDCQSATCDTLETKIMDEKTFYSAKQNEANINCIKTHDFIICDVFENAIQTIKNGDHHKLEKLFQSYNGLSSYTDDAGRSLLHIAAIHGNGEICQVLLQNSDVQKQLDSQDKEGRTALHYGIVHNNKRIKRLLLNNGALSDIPDNNLETALDLALNMINAAESDSD